MVVKKGYDAVGVEELFRHFFGIGKQEVEPASESEIETFIFLMDTNPELGLDFLNCWFESKNLSPLSDCVLSNEEFLDIIKKRTTKKIKNKKRKVKHDC